MLQYVRTNLMLSVLTQAGIASNGSVSLRECKRWTKMVNMMAKIHVHMRNRK